MTKINRLVLDGFKSFGKRTELIFGNNFNCVLGPNGSGKSNILDSLCFVLGRLSSKSLRAEKTSNLIYNGGKSKKPLNKAEVSLVFDNNGKTFPLEENEIKISRIIKEDGQSVYKINDKKSTRQEILELMSRAKINPDGYNIILQGDIIRLVEMHPVERRQIVEEIAGISVYEEKKQKALRELEKVEEKLKEADIRLAERRTYLKELKEDRDQAVKYKEVRQKLEESKASHVFKKIGAKDKEKASFDEKINKEKSKLDEITKQIDEKKNEIKGKKEEIGGINKEINEKGEKEQQKINKEIEDLRVFIASDKTRLESNKTETSRLKQRITQLQSDIREHESQLKGFDSEIEDLNRRKLEKLKEISKLDAEITKFRQKNKLEDLEASESKIIEIDRMMDELQKETNSFAEKKQSLMREKDMIEYQLRNIDEKIAKVKQIEKENSSKLNELKKKKEQLKTTSEELGKGLEDDKSLLKQLTETRELLLRNQENLSKLEAKNSAIKETIFADMAVKKIIENKKKFKGVYGTISELGTVNPKYSLALEIAAGGKLKDIVVEDDKVASDCVKFLKENKFGTATFLPLNRLKEHRTHPDVIKMAGEKGVHDLAISLVKFDKRYEAAFNYVFRDALVVDGIDTARKLGIGRARYVTLDGDIAHISGAIHGGYREKRPSIGFKETDLSSDIEECGKNILNLKKTVDDIEKSRLRLESEISKLRETRANLEGDIIKLEKTLHLEDSDLEATNKTKEKLNDDLEKLDKAYKEVESSISGLNKKISDFKIQKQQHRDKISQIRNPAILAELNAFEDKKKEINNEVITVEGGIQNIGLRKKDIIGPEIINIQKIIKQHEKELIELDESIRSITDKIRQNGQLLKDKEAAQRKFYGAYKDLFTKRDKITDDMQKIDQKIESLNEVSHKFDIQINSLNIEHARICAELAGLQQEFEQFRGITIIKEKSENELKRDIEKFEKMVIEIGNVNMRALEIYDEAEKEFNSLNEKKEVLGREKDDVISMMDEIEGRKKELFIKTFDVLNTQFKAIFGELYTKGEAGLVVENPEKPFDAGVLIKVKITGNKYLDIRSLSGGEKTLTALAFIFAIQEFDPASFYILDEVDAALDKKNSEKLAKLLKKYSEKAQYVVISHNDAIISEAEKLYGISMNPDGISRVNTLEI